MEKTYTVVMDYSDEFDRLIGRVLEFPDTLLDAVDKASLFEKTKQYIAENIRKLGYAETDESYKIRILYGEGFIHKKRREDPEVALFLDCLRHHIEISKASFSSADKFAGIAANSLLYLNGGAVIAILTFYGNIATNIKSPINGVNLMFGVIGFTVGLVLAVLACCFGFFSQNEQTHEQSYIIEMYIGYFRRMIFFTDLIDINKHRREVNDSMSLISHKFFFSSAKLRMAAIFLGLTSLASFTGGAYYAMQSLYQLTGQ